MKTIKIFDVWQGKQAGLIVMGNDYSYLTISKDEAGYKLDQINCKNADQGGIEQKSATARLKGNEVFLRIQVSSPDAICKFSIS